MTDAEIAQRLVDHISGAFATYTVQQLTPYVAQARRLLAIDFWNDLYDDASFYLAAHLIAQDAAGTTGISGPVASQTAGQLSISFATPDQSESTFSSTSWGRRYEEMLTTQRFRVPLVV